MQGRQKEKESAWQAHNGATAAVMKLLLDWLLPLGLVYETALLPPHMRYRRISEPTRDVFRIPHAGAPMGPTCQWQHRSSGRRGCNQPSCSRASATPGQVLEGGRSTAATTPPAQGHGSAGPQPPNCPPNPRRLGGTPREWPWQHISLRLWEWWRWPRGQWREASSSL